MKKACNFLERLAKIKKDGEVVRALCWKTYKNAFSQNNQRKLVLIDSLLFGMTVGNMIIMKSQ